MGRAFLVATVSSPGPPKIVCVIIVKMIGSLQSIGCSLNNKQHYMLVLVLLDFVPSLRKRVNIHLELQRLSTCSEWLRVQDLTPSCTWYIQIVNTSQVSRLHSQSWKSMIEGRPLARCTSFSCFVAKYNLGWATDLKCCILPWLLQRKRRLVSSLMVWGVSGIS